ncbi:uncharacterized protein LOC131633722 [Vicia villosa]|uniref:uncharacterized protein LOC131597947 n=1 Tax=Vicia villosa TaxID=3911 RepID=UPI00273B1469|nr:uncharacterized protein LOC131597947 [Vicia villosa]XP_058753456.1 uncharacterized protein LOC131626638 [Vicia villosa]XP_058760391.1 uncharacterized protein LOC131633722 [Vicia villosa]
MASYGSSGPNRRSQSSNTFISGASQYEIAPTCSCGAKAVVRTVKKKGRNLGKLFWGCRYFVSEPDNVGCNFFEWYENHYNDETNPGIHASVISKCSKCEEKDVEIKMLRRASAKDDNEMLKNCIKMMKLQVYVIMFLVMLVVGLMFTLIKQW